MRQVLSYQVPDKVHRYEQTAVLLKHWSTVAVADCQTKYNPVVTEDSPDPMAHKHHQLLR